MFESVFDSPGKLKQCTECKAVKKATTRYFYKNTKGHGGLDSKCKECKKKLRRNLYKSQQYARSKGIVI